MTGIAENEEGVFEMGDIIFLKFHGHDGLKWTVWTLWTGTSRIFLNLINFPEDAPQKKLLLTKSNKETCILE